MMAKLKPKNLGQQVAVETRRRNMVFFSLILVAIIYVMATLVFGDMGLIKFLELRENRNRLEAEIKMMEKEKETMKAQVEALRKDPFSIEKHAREEYGMAKPDELIFQFKENGR